MRRELLACLVACGCGDNDVVDCTDSTRPNEVAVHSRYPLTQYRVEGGRWEDPISLDVDDQVLCVDNAYTVMVQCTTSFGLYVQQHSATLEDGPLELFYCDDTPADPSSVVTVSGQMAQAGAVAVGNTTTFGQFRFGTTRSTRPQSPTMSSRSRIREKPRHPGS